MPIRLLISDVDGTIVTTDKVLTPASIAAVAKLRAAGIRFAVVSSRPPRGMAMLVAPLGIDTPMGAFNGGTLVAPDLSQIEARVVPKMAAHAALDLFDKRGVDAWVFADGEWLLTNPTAHYVPRETRTVQFAYRRVDDLRPFLDRAGKIVGTTDDFDLLARVETELQELLGPAANAHRSQKYYLDVTHPDANKGTAVHAIAAHLDIAIADVACIGDMTNDLPMFAVAGTSIAMGNGPAEVRARAQHVTTGNDEDGFAAAVDRFVLPTMR
jgi:Cof subfamily protein (haloacid dehalogenase superfamily)